MNCVKTMFSRICNLIGGGIQVFIKEHPLFLLCVFYKNDFWKLRESCNKKRTKFKETLYYAYLQRFGSWIGLGAVFEDKPNFPHSFYGIFISHNAHIGKNAVIFQQVTIGSNTIQNSKTFGSPTIGDNCYIGSGAKIIGAITLGNNVRVGANCILTRDVPDNSVCVLRGLDIIQKGEELDNKWISVNEN